MLFVQKIKRQLERQGGTGCRFSAVDCQLPVLLGIGVDCLKKILLVPSAFHSPSVEIKGTV
jgi:hypothetical protein